jgi:hypothetical protein
MQANSDELKPLFYLRNLLNDLLQRPDKIVVTTDEIQELQSAAARLTKARVEFWYRRCSRAVRSGVRSPESPGRTSIGLGVSGERRVGLGVNQCWHSVASRPSTGIHLVPAVGITSVLVAHWHRACPLAGCRHARWRELGDVEFSLTVTSRTAQGAIAYDPCLRVPSGERGVFDASGYTLRPAFSRPKTSDRGWPPAFSSEPKMPNGRSGGFVIETADLEQIVQAVSPDMVVGKVFIGSKPQETAAADIVRLIQQCSNDRLAVEEQDHVCYIVHLSKWLIVDSSSPIFTELRSRHVRWRAEHQARTDR